MVVFGVLLPLGVYLVRRGTGRLAEEVICDEGEECADEEDADKSFHEDKKKTRARRAAPGV